MMLPSEVVTDRKGPAVRKLYYTIGEVSELTGVPAHVLRYWESEFPQLRPKKGRTGNRTYQQKDLETIERIRSLLYEQRFTIAGAKAQLARNGVVEETVETPPDSVEVLSQVRQELHEILRLLGGSKE